MDKELYLKELNEQGRTLFSCDKYDEAIKMYEKAMAEDEMYLPSYFGACEAYIMADRFEEAKKMMKRVLMVEKDNGEAHFHLGNIALLEDNIEDGKLQYAKAINSGYDIPEIYINLASICEDKGEWEEALSYYTKAVVRDKTCFSAKISKVQIYMMLGRNLEALNCVDDLIETNPEIFEGHHFKFVILATEGKLSEAGAALDKAQKLFPDDQGFMFDRVKLYELMEKFDDAMKILEDVEWTAPKEVIITEKARLLVALGELEESKRLLESYDDDPIMPEMKKLLMAIYLDEKNYCGMIDCAEKILSLDEYDESYFSALYFKAYATKMTGDEIKARKAYEEAVKIFQQACSINSGLLDLYIYRAICYRELKNYDKANEMLDYIALVDENCAEVYYIRHLIYKDLGDERADAMIAKAKSLNKDIAALLGE